MSGARPWLVLACRWLMGVVMAWAGLAKIGDVGAFVGDVHNFRMLPIALENVVAMTLPWIELVAAVALLGGIRARAGAAVSLALMLLFTVGVAQGLARGLDIGCGCFGTGDATRVGLSKLAQNVGMVVASGVAMLRRD